MEVLVQAVQDQVIQVPEVGQVTPAPVQVVDQELAVEADQVTQAPVQVVDQEPIYPTLMQKVSQVVLLQNLDAMLEADIILMDIGILPFTMQMVMQ